MGRGGGSRESEGELGRGKKGEEMREGRGTGQREVGRRGEQGGERKRGKRGRRVGRGGKK